MQKILQFKVFWQLADHKKKLIEKKKKLSRIRKKTFYLQKL
jgi:hypothetical protein